MDGHMGDSELQSAHHSHSPPPPDQPISLHPSPAHPFGCHNNACCHCVARFSTDCAVICCCPLALLHLLALTFIKLPSIIAWRMIVKLKKRLCLCTRSPADVSKQDGLNPASSTQRESSEGSDASPHVLQFDSPKLVKYFEADHLGFGGISLKRD